ncbi:MAG TPA: hypothetical protein VK668_00115 [Mucilaginibacter sp.]|nr:hypothetical protein [Mucilaginibacter sp.]
MKKIHYLLAFILAATALSACNPMDSTYKQLGDLPVPTAPPATVTITLAAADYGLLPATDYAKTSLSYKTQDDAAVSIPTILAAKYPGYSDKSTANVTYANSPAKVVVADTTFANVAYTLTDADYNNSFKDFSASQVLSWLLTKYQNPLPNQLALLTFNYYESGVISVATQSFLYLNGAWKKIYTISPAQYTSIGKGGTFNDFSSSDNANLQGYFNTFLKVDPAVASTAKKYDIQYVSFKYFATNNFQRVKPLTFDGANWVVTPIDVASPLAFLKTNGVWVADNTVNYTLIAADYTLIANIPGVASADAIDNLKAHGNFSLIGAAWTDDQINAGIVAVLKSKYPAAVANQKFVITYSAYNGATISVTKTFQYDGTNFNKI